MAIEYVEKKKKKLSISDVGCSDRNSLLERYLMNSTLDTKDVVGMAADMLLAGIDTVVTSIWIFLSIIIGQI